MTTTVRAKAQLLQNDTQEVLAEGIAVIWGDPDDWGGIFEVQEAADALTKALAATGAGGSFSAQLHTYDGRQRRVIITPSEFNADDAHPLTFRGEGEIDTAKFHAFSSATGRIGMERS